MSLPPRSSCPDDVDEDTKYEYNVRITHSSNGFDDNANFSVIVRDTDLSIVCDHSEVYEGGDDIPLPCTVKNEPPGASYSWGPWVSTTDTDLLTSGTDTPTPTFSPPDNVDTNTNYDYLLALSVNGVELATDDVRVTVKDRPDITVTCDDSPYEADEGDDDIDLECEASGAPGDDADYTWSWSPEDNLTGANTASPMFAVPDDVDRDTTWTYAVTASAANADDGASEVTVTVRDTDPSITCTDSEVYEATPDFTLDCSAKNEPSGATYSWTANTAGAPALIGDTDTLTPTFEVPDDIPGRSSPDKDGDIKKTYEYTVTMMSGSSDIANSDITVTVLEKPNIRCAADPQTLSVYYHEPVGGRDFHIRMSCTSFAGAPVGSSYMFEWTDQDGMSDTGRLSATNIRVPIFDVPENGPSRKYQYLLRVSAANADDLFIEAHITVSVVKITCEDSPYEVDEGDDDIVLECEASGAPYRDPDYMWSWSPKGNLTDHNTATPTFDVPDNIDRDTTYTYTVRAKAENAKDGVAEVTVTVLNKPSLTLGCATPSPVYEGSEDFAIDCEASGAPDGSMIAYAWTARGDTPDTALLMGTDTSAPTFDVPETVEANTDYEYTLTVSAENALDATADVTVTVLDKKPLDVACATPSPVYEGSEDFALDCEASGAPLGSTIAYAWTARGDTPDTALLMGTDTSAPTFDVPETVEANTDYEYTLTVSAENALDATADVTVTVLDKKPLGVACATPSPVYEGSEDFALDCEASGAPSGSTIAYAWTARGDTPDTALLMDTDTSAPTFDVPETVEANTDYEYTLTVSAENALDATADVTVTVLDKKPLDVACATPSPVYEGSEDFALDCEASGAPSGSTIAYAWTPRGNTQDTALLSATDIADPTFSVPDEVDENETHEYLLTVSAENAEEATAEVTVRVLNLGTIALVCASPPLVYEGSEDFALECSISGDTEDVDYTYAWAARGDTQDTALLSATDIPSPTFHVPDVLEATTTYEYLLTASAENTEDATADLTVTVLNKGALAVACSPSPLAYEGAEDFALDCEASGAPGDNPQYDYVWAARGDTQDTSLLSATDIASPTFDVPEEVDATTTYEYLLTASAKNADPGSVEVTVTVLNKGALAVVCRDPGSAYEGSSDISLDCSASGAPGGDPQYTYVWTARGDTQDTSLLSATDIASPTFHVPAEVDATTIYGYLLTVSAANAESGSASVSVTVLNKPELIAVCEGPTPVYEGSADFAFDCSASGAPAGSRYDYVWTARGDTQDTALLSATDIVSPTFLVPEEVDATTTYEYLLTVSARNAEDATAEVKVTVLNTGALLVACADPGSAYEGSADFAFDCAAVGASVGSAYEYVWTARGDTQDTALLSATDIASPTFYVPDEVDEATTYEYLLTVSAANAEDAMTEVAVTVLNKEPLALACTSSYEVYEESEDFALDCSASGAPGDDPQYAYAWTARGDTQDTALLSATDIASPTFYVPDEVDETTTYEYLLTVSAENAEDATAQVTVTVLDKPVLAVVCADPGSVYEGSEDFAFDCSASGAPAGSVYAYVWTARGDTQNTSLLSRADIEAPVFYVPDAIDVTTTYEYLLTVSAANAEDATAQMTVTVLDRVETPEPEPVSPPVAESPPQEPSDPSALGVTVSASPLQFGVQSADTEVSLDPATDRITTQISGPHHAGRMTLSRGGGAPLDENGEMELSIELTSPVALKRADAVETSTLVLTPLWSYAESCEQLSSQTIGGLYTEITLLEDTCRLLRFGGELDLTGVPSGRYTGSLDIILRSGEREETRSVEVSVTVVPAQRVITIGPGGVRFDTSRELPAGLTEEQNLSIYPDMAFLTEGQPDGVFELSNPSLIPLEITVSARFGYTEATETGREVVVEDIGDSDLGDLSGVVDIYPGVLVLQPGETGLVRYGVKEEALPSMSDRGYAAFFDVVSSPRQYVDLGRMPEEVTGDRTARVTMRVPGVYVPDEGASQLRAALLAISYVDAFSATFLLETTDHPFVGEVAAYDGEGRELGRRETLVYTRSRVRVPLERMPEEGVVVLRFLPRGSDRVPEPVTVPWNAPGRDIGDAGGKNKTSPNAAVSVAP